MKTNPFHILWFMVLMVSSHPKAFAMNSNQEPQQTRRFDEYFKERYKGNKYNYEGEDIVTKTPRGSGNYEDYKADETQRKEQNNSNFFSMNLEPLRWLFFLAIALAVVYLVYILFNEGGSGLFSSKHHKKIYQNQEITSENIEHTDIDSLIIKAEKENNFRLAVRYYYLLVLKNLSLKNYIKFEDDKTNSEYLNELDTRSFKDKFAYTSYLYNYIWYGEFPVDLLQYQMAKNNFIMLLNQIKS